MDGSTESISQRILKIMITSLALYSGAGRQGACRRPVTSIPGALRLNLIRKQPTTLGTGSRAIASGLELNGASKLTITMRYVSDVILLPSIADDH
jgi:hypothetical protein